MAIQTDDYPPAHPISSVENVLRLLLMLQARPTIRVSDASAELDVARSTAHRLLAMLKSYGFVEQEATTRAYRAGPALAALGVAAIRNEGVVPRMRPLLEQLRYAVDETVHLAVLDERNSRFIESIEGTQAIRAAGRIGFVFPAYAAASGMALLAELDDTEVRRLFPDEVLRPFNGRTLSSRDELLHELEVVRRQGYATNFGESEMAIAAVAMALRNSDGEAVAAITVSAPRGRLPQESVPDVVAAMRTTVERARLILR